MLGRGDGFCLGSGPGFDPNLAKFSLFHWAIWAIYVLDTGMVYPFALNLGQESAGEELPEYARIMKRICRTSPTTTPSLIRIDVAKDFRLSAPRGESHQSSTLVPTKKRRRMPLILSDFASRSKSSCLSILCRGLYFYGGSPCHLAACLDPSFAPSGARQLPRLLRLRPPSFPSLSVPLSAHFPSTKPVTLQADKSSFPATSSPPLGRERASRNLKSKIRRHVRLLLGSCSAFVRDLDYECSDQLLNLFLRSTQPKSCVPTARNRALIFALPYTVLYPTSCSYTCQCNTVHSQGASRLSELPFGGYATQSTPRRGV